MKNRLPSFFNKRKICIICEGDEEYDYLHHLYELGVWNSQYAITLDNEYKLTTDRITGAHPESTRGNQG